MRIWPALVIGMMWLGGVGVYAQAPSDHTPGLEFDVASVRQNKSGMPWAGGDPMASNVPYSHEPVFRDTHGVFSATNWPLYNLIFFAYKTTTGQGDVLIKSLPEWVNTDFFNVEARTDNQNVTKDEMREMMRSLLEERFHIKIHTETREIPLYGVVLAKPGVLGPGLRPHPASEPCSVIAPPLTNGKPQPGGPPPANAVRDDGFPILCGSFVNIPTTAQWHRREGSRDLPIGMIGEVFGNLGRMGRPTVDKTGLTGNFDFVIDYVMEAPPGVEVPPTVSGPSFHDALRDQLGLKLEPIKGPFTFLIVDHVEHPTEN
jgi:uncharacterized protein (TIGR03435 family)